MDAGQRLQAQEDRLQAPKAHFYAKTLQMKIILSRKGFDSGSGGVPSPIFPDGAMMSLPIPDKSSGIAYEDVAGNYWVSMGEAVSQLAGFPQAHRAHLDPDLVANSLPRKKGWRPIFGQVDAAEGHLRLQGVGESDIFLFFGLYPVAPPQSSGGQQRAPSTTRGYSIPASAGMIASNLTECC